jgi:hypothetical protein
MIDIGLSAPFLATLLLDMDTGYRDRGYLIQEPCLKEELSKIFSLYTSVKSTFGGLDPGNSHCQPASEDCSRLPLKYLQEPQDTIR